MSTKGQRAGELGQPAWEIARLYPDQGAWTEDDYLALSTNHQVEFSDGVVEVLSMPTEVHQAIVACLFQVIAAYVQPAQLGRVVFAPFRVRLRPGKWREPDLAFMLADHASRRHNEYWEGADLVIEVVSDDDRRRDTDVKRREYAEAGIPEYWIVDPQTRRITVLRLAGTEYDVHAEGDEGTHVTSAVLPGLRIDVAAVFQSAELS